MEVGHDPMGTLTTKQEPRNTWTPVVIGVVKLPAKKLGAGLSSLGLVEGLHQPRFAASRIVGVN